MTLPIIEMPSSLISTRHCPMTATDVETTGLIAGFHEIVQMAFVVLDSDLNPTDDYFDHFVRPQFPERADPKAMEVHNISLEELKNRGLPADIVRDMFHEWFKDLNLPLNKRLTPLAQNWSMEKSFYEDFFGIEAMWQYFSLPRDTLRVAIFANDRACFRCESLPFPENCKLPELCKRLGVSFVDHHNALADSIATAAVYKELLRKI